jgi:acetylornithine deacetylase
VADNVVASYAEARLMARLVTDAENVKRVIETWIAGRAALDWGAIMPPVRLSPLPGFESSVLAFATDIPALTKWGTPYLYGPGSVRVAHRDDEHVGVEELRAAVAGYERIVHTALGAPAT